jgi:hypothetical protein
MPSTTFRETSEEAPLDEQYVQDAFHSYLKSSLAQAKAERLLDAELLSSAEGDLMIAGTPHPIYRLILLISLQGPHSVSSLPHYAARQTLPLYRSPDTLTIPPQRPPHDKCSPSPTAHPPSYFMRTLHPGSRTLTPARPSTRDMQFRITPETTTRHRASRG